MKKSNVVVVTGGDGLLGRKIIEYFHSKELIAISIDINDPKDKFSYKADISNECEINDTINRITEDHGEIIGWVNNAYPRSSDWGKGFDQLVYDSLTFNLNKHLGGYMICSKCILEYMKRNNIKGSLVNMGSIYGINGPDFEVYSNTDMTMPAAYSAIKGGVLNFTRFLASYYGEFGIRVNSVSPGGIYDGQNNRFVEAYSKKTPLKRMGMDYEIPPSVYFLISTDSSYITGHNLIIDGGWTII